MSFGKKALILLVPAVGWTTTALGQGYGVEGERTAVGARAYSIDIQPLPLLAATEMGGYKVGAMAAIGGEMAVARHVGFFGNLSGASIRLSDSQASDAMSKNSDPVPRKVDAAGLTLGGRFYRTSSTEDSWFSSADLSATRMVNQWVYGNETVNEGLWVLTPAVEGGYRWVWNSGFLLRLGLGAQAPVYMTRDYNQAAVIDVFAASNTESKVRQLEDRQAVNPIVDVALGYAF